MRRDPQISHEDNILITNKVSVNTQNQALTTENTTKLQHIRPLSVVFKADILMCFRITNLQTTSVNTTTLLVVIIPPTNAQLFFIIYIYLAYMFRPYPVIIRALRYTKGFKICLKYLQYIRIIVHLLVEWLQSYEKMHGITHITLLVFIKTACFDPRGSSSG